MRFTELLASLIASETLTDDVATQVTEAYEFDLSIPQAAVDERDLTIAALQNEITALKLHNYDLLMSNVDAPDPGDNDGDAGDDLDEGETITTEDLFEEED